MQLLTPCCKQTTTLSKWRRILSEIALSIAAVPKALSSRTEALSPRTEVLSPNPERFPQGGEGSHQYPNCSPRGSQGNPQGNRKPFLGHVGPS